jgi:hypothetical protein
MSSDFIRGLKAGFVEAVAEMFEVAGTTPT